MSLGACYLSFSMECTLLTKSKWISRRYLSLGNQSLVIGVECPRTMTLMEINTKLGLFQRSFIQIFRTDSRLWKISAQKCKSRSQLLHQDPWSGFFATGALKMLSLKSRLLSSILKLKEEFQSSQLLALGT